MGGQVRREESRLLRAYLFFATKHPKMSRPKFDVFCQPNHAQRAAAVNSVSKPGIPPVLVAIFSMFDGKRMYACGVDLIDEKSPQPNLHYGTNLGHDKRQIWKT